MNTIIFIVFGFFAVINVIIKASKGELKDRTRTISVSKPIKDTNSYNHAKQQYIRNQAVSKSSTLKDDKNNDWLALQLREEAKAKRRVSDMFSLKTSHSSSCEAEALKRFHENDCNAEGIDRAKGR